MKKSTTGYTTRGYTLIEMLVVMGIILLMLTMVLLSVTSMLRSSTMSRAVSLIVSAADEARTTAVTVRRSTTVDDTQLDQYGYLSRLTVAGPVLNENFETYNINSTASAATVPPLSLPSSNGWINTTGTGPSSWALSTAPVPCIQNDGSQCLRMVAPNSYWNVGAHVDKAKAGDFEVLVEARVKLLPQPATTLSGSGAATRLTHSIRVMACIQDAGNSISNAYGMTLTLNPTNTYTTATPPARNISSNIQIDRGSSSTSLNSALTGAVAPAVNPLTIDTLGSGGAASPTCDVIENVWYRVMLSVKLVADQTGATNGKATVAGKVYADGQLEPLAWTVGPVVDNNPLSAGPAGFSCTGYDALADDVLVDGRPIRVIPAGLRMDCMDPTLSTPAAPVVAASGSAYNFPVIFRPDGTTAQLYIIRITDMTSGDKRYVRIDQNTGHSRTCHSITEALQQ